MPRSASPTAVVAAVLLFAAALAACDDAPGLPAEVQRPSVTAFALTPLTDSLATDAPAASIPLVIEATLAGEGRIVVRAVVRYGETVSTRDSLVTEVRAEAQPGPVRIELPITLPRGATGDYAVTLLTEGADGRTGDGASGVFHFRAASLGPPVISNVTAPATVARPATEGARPTPFRITADLSDPDGLVNVAAVVVTDETGAVIQELFDEGRTGRATDDERPGDGRYTVTLGIPFAFQPGTYTLAIVALDRAATQSAPAPFTFEVR